MAVSLSRLSSEGLLNFSKALASGSLISAPAALRLMNENQPNRRLHSEARVKSRLVLCGRQSWDRIRNWQFLTFAITVAICCQFMLQSRVGKTLNQFVCNSQQHPLHGCGQLCSCLQHQLQQLPRTTVSAIAS